MSSEIQSNTQFSVDHFMVSVSLQDQSVNLYIVLLDQSVNPCKVSLNQSKPAQSFTRLVYESAKLH